MKKSVFILIPLFLLSVGCAHNHKVEGIHSTDEVPAGFKVSIGKAEISDGEVVDVFAPSCHIVVGGHGQKKKECHSKKVGQAKVLKVLDDKSAIIEPLNDLKLNSEMNVEKQKGE